MDAPSSHDLKTRRMSAYAQVAIFVYMIALGVVGGKLAARFWPFRSSPDAVEVLDTSYHLLELEGRIATPSLNLDVQIAHPSVYREHSHKLMRQHLQWLGLDPDQHSLLELRISNRSLLTTLDLQESSGLAQLTDESGTVHRNIPLPQGTSDERMKLHLAQRRPQGTLAPQTHRRFWLLFPGDVSLEKLSHGILTLGEGQVIELSIRAITLD